MKKCSANCIPCCDFCVHCLHAYAADGGGRCEPLGCMLHRDYEHQSIVEACGECDDFQCFRVPPSNADRIRGMTDEELANELTRNPPIPCRMCEYWDCKLSLCHAGTDDFTCTVAYAEALTLNWLQQPAETEETE